MYVKKWMEINVRRFRKKQKKTIWSCRKLDCDEDNNAKRAARKCSGAKKAHLKSKIQKNDVTFEVPSDWAWTILQNEIERNLN